MKIDERPLLSFEPSGTIQKTVIAIPWKGPPHVHQYVMPVTAMTDLNGIARNALAWSSSA